MPPVGRSTARTIELSIRESHASLVLRPNAFPKVRATFAVKSWQEKALSTTSYSRGPSQPPLLEQTIPQHFASVVQEHGDRIAIISHAQNKRLTYRDLDDKSNILAHGLRERGVKKGDRVAISLGNSWEFAVTTYSLFKLGAIMVPLNPAFNATQVICALSHLDAAHLIISTETNLPFKRPSENITLLKQLTPDLSSRKVHSACVPSLQNIFLVDNSSSRVDISSYSALVSFTTLFSSNAAPVVSDSPLHPDDTINIQFTSGTTSMPKAAALTHHSILNNGFSIGSRMGLLPSDIICCPPPLFHCFGSILGYMASATHGSALLLPSEAFDPLATLHSVQEEQATALYGVSTMFVAELELLANGAVNKEGFSNLRTGIAAGSSVPSHLMSKLHKELNLTGLTICYGMTETSPVSCMTTPDDPIELRTGSVGKPLPHVEVKIVDTHDRNKILLVGQRGELVVSGYLVMKGYWDDPARTDEVRVVEGDKVWMHTGDEASMDADGYVKITGRIKDLIIRGGENIHPLEIENVLFMMDEVSEVSVVGLPDERYGEVVAAFVVTSQGVTRGLDDAGVGDAPIDTGAETYESRMKTLGRPRILTKDQIQGWVRDKLSNHLVPKYIFWIDEYPKTASGKIQKFKLREMGCTVLNLKDDMHSHLSKEEIPIIM